MSLVAAEELQRRIDTGIPLSRAMGYRITALEDTQICVEAPLDPNINIHGTGFAGSLYALGILTAWGLAAHVIASSGVAVELVVAEASIRYRAPLRCDIVCRCAAPESAVHAFVDSLVAQGQGRITLDVTIGEGPAAVLQAVMHARRV